MALSLQKRKDVAMLRINHKKFKSNEEFSKKKVLIKFKDFKELKEFITGGNPVLFLQNNHQKKKEIK
jgi:hypothetical protein